MAVVPGAPRIDVALDAIAALVGEPRIGTIEDAIASLTVAALWRQVYDGARDRDDAKVMQIANDERRHALATYRALTRGDPG